MKLAMVIVSVLMDKHYTFLVQLMMTFFFLVITKTEKVYSFPRYQTGFHFYQQAWEDCISFNNKDCCTRVKNKRFSNILGTDTGVFPPNESRTYRGIIRDVLVEISTDDIKNVLGGEKEKKIQVIRYIKGGKEIPLVELVFQKECTFNKNLQNGITLELVYFTIDPKHTTKRIIQCFNCQQWGSLVSKICKN